MSNLVIYNTRLHTMHKLYSVRSYTLPSSQFDDNMEEFTTPETVEQLADDFCYHFRIHPATTYIFFGDLDNYPQPIDTFIDLLHQFLLDRYNITFDKEHDFKYTKNDGKQGSYHYSIPKWNLCTEKLKEIHTEFLKAYTNQFTVKMNKKETTCIDTTIYSEHWFRCPNQSKGDGKRGTHKIIYGNMEDFIIDYIPSTSVNINDFQLISNNTITTIANTALPIIQLPVGNSTNNTNNTNPDTANASIATNISNTRTIIPQNQNIVLSEAISKVDIYKLLFDECFTQPRFDTYDNWIKVGMAIKNSVNNPDEAINLYIYYSSKGSNYEGPEAIKRKYNSFKIKNDGYGIGTIYKMALEDNKQRAISILSKNKLQFLPTDFCRFIKAMAGNRFFYKVTNNNYKLYSYNDKYWQTDEILLRSFISCELFELLKDILVDVYWKITNPRDFQTYKSKLDKLNTMAFKKEIIETYKEYNAKYDIEFDNKWWLFGFNNVVYDMQQRQFRDYEYDDYVSITTGYEWREPTNEEMATMWQLINSIMPIEAERNLFLQILATGIDGRCIEKFIIFNAAGGNGKGVINDIMLTMLGPYGMIGNNNILFEKSKMGSNPEKANLHKKRYVVFREPDEADMFQNSVIKELTGGGQFSARGLYESETDKELNNTMICECNAKPAFRSSILKADIRRIIDIYFRSSFTTNENEIDPANFIFRANPEYKTKEFQQNHKFALFKILTEYHWIFYNDNGSILKLPESVQLRTNQYLENSSDLVKWFQFEYRQDDPEDDISYTPVADIYNEFKLSDTYNTMNKKEKEKYTKFKFFEFIRTNIFFKKYYKDRHTDRHGDYKRVIIRWTKNNTDYVT